MQSKAKTVAQYLAELPADRREIVAAVRKVIRADLNQGFEEGMQYGMIGYYVPHSVYAAGYHCDPRQPLPFVCLASQKNHLSLYLSCLYMDAKAMRAFTQACADNGRKLDMGKSCIRFKKLADLPLDIVAATIRGTTARKFIADYEAIIPARTDKPTTTRSVKKSAKKRTPAKSTVKVAKRKPAKR